MADTSLFVQWVLGYCCALRQTVAQVDPWREVNAVLPLRNYCHALRKRHVFENQVVCSFTGASGPSDEAVWLPCAVQSVEPMLGPFGGLKRVRNLCRDCSANVARAVYPEALGGCWGDIWFDPWNKELDKCLCRILAASGYEAEFARLFRVTKPAWFGLWCQSPLSSAQCRLLKRLLDEGQIMTLASEIGRPHGWVPTDDELGEQGLEILHSLQQFSGALDVALAHHLALYVRLPPPGHSDCGWDTGYGHCATCHAEASGARWVSSAKRLTSQRCRVCGETAAPVAGWERAWDPGQYESVPGARTLDLARPEDEAFICRYLQFRGLAPAQADAVVAKQKAWEEHWRSGDRGPFGVRFWDKVHVAALCGLIVLFFAAAIAWGVWAVWSFCKQW